jgi:hypothetical protein
MSLGAQRQPAAQQLPRRENQVVETKQPAQAMQSERETMPG